MKAEWTRFRLAEVARISAGNPAPQEKKLFENGKYPFFRTSDVGRIRTGRIRNAEDQLNDSGIKGLTLHRAGTILLPKSGASTFLNHRVVMDVDGYVSSHLATVLPDTTKIDGQFLWYALLSVAAQDLSTDTAYPTLSLGQIKEIPVHAPPLDKQRRIVAVLDKAFAGIAAATANAQKNLTNARALFESELDAEIVQVQAKFSGKSLSDACERITVGHVGPMKTRYLASGIPFLRSQNVRPFKLALDNVLYIDEAFDAELKKSRLQAGDVAVVRTGYPGTAAVIPESLSTANCADLVIIRPSSALNPHYLAALLNSNTGKASVAGKLNGAAQKHFNVGAAKKMKVAIPSLTEQQRIVDRIELIDQKSRALHTVYQSKLAALSELKQSLLYKALTGELT